MSNYTEEEIDKTRCMINYWWDKREDLENVNQDILKEHFTDVFEFWKIYKRSKSALNAFIKKLD